MAHFRYTTRLQGRTIRLIKLEPGDDNLNGLSCSLEHVSLDDNPEYDAISYCWGQEAPSVPILCHGELLFITQNLHDALRQFQRHDHAVSLWADAVCINQADTEEKNEQVPLMGRIYGQARHVRVWLGLQEENTSEATHTIMELSRRARHYSERFGISLSSLAESDYHDSWIAVADDDFEPDWAGVTPDLRSLLTLVRYLMNPWFSRVWVIQEVALSRGQATLHCGDVALPWNDFELGLLFTNHCGLLREMLEFVRLSREANLHRVVALVKTTARFRAAHESGQDAGLGLYWLLRTNHNACATDPRDMVFGLLGMVGRDNDKSLGLPVVAADYTMEATDVYLRVAESFWQDSLH